MKLECMKHGEVEGVRKPNGRLGCSVCLSEKPAEPPKPPKSPKAQPSSAARERARKMVDHLMDPEVQAKHREEREAEFKECLVDAMEDRINYEERKQ